MIRRKSLWKSFAVASSLAVAAFSVAQLPNLGCSLYANLLPASFGASSGNDCWGYVSPSGREYAIVGLNNQVAYVEITNPASPVVIAQIPHTSSTWGDIKVYQNVAYSVSETAGTGIQVVDLSQIDSGIVTLVRTITSPGRSHNLAIDTINGFLYTCGSRDGTGTTMCFSLANPTNPVRVGLNSMTADYQHDGVPVTYTSGPYAGKQLWFGFSEGRGVDVYDLTNKNAPVLLKRMTYPNIGYCHQGWLSEDKKYLYVDDEFDESNLAVSTRSLIFNVEDPGNGFFVGTFSTQAASIDHNQYVRDGFIYQANYRSGLRIFDQYFTPEAPVQTGFYDTYVADDLRGYDGAWSNFSYFPSGTTIVTDINKGLFVINVMDATTRNLPPTESSLGSCKVVSGGLANVIASDNSRMILRSSSPGTNTKYPMQIELSRTAVDSDPARIRIVVESNVTKGDLVDQSVELFDWIAGQYVVVNESTIRRTDSTVTSDWLQSPARFVNSATKQVKARLRWNSNAFGNSSMSVGIDQVRFDITQ